MNESPRPIIQRRALFYRADRGIAGRQLISGSTFRCVVRHFLFAFNYRLANEIIAREGDPRFPAIFFVFFLLLRSLLFLFLRLPLLLRLPRSRRTNFLRTSNIYQRLIRIPQASWRDCEQLRSFLRGPFPPDQLFAFAEINRKLRRDSRFLGFPSAGGRSSWRRDSRTRVIASRYRFTLLADRFVIIVPRAVGNSWSLHRFFAIFARKVPARTQFSGYTGLFKLYLNRDLLRFSVISLIRFSFSLVLISFFLIVSYYPFTLLKIKN